MALLEKAKTRQMSLVWMVPPWVLRRLNRRVVSSSSSVMSCVFWFQRVLWWFERLQFALLAFFLGHFLALLKVGFLSQVGSDVDVHMSQAHPGKTFSSQFSLAFKAVPSSFWGKWPKDVEVEKVPASIAYLFILFGVLPTSARSGCGSGQAC